MVKKKQEDWEKKFEKKMEDFADSFGKDMESKFCTYEVKHAKYFSVGGIIISLFILAWGIIWLGNDLLWWSIPFPFWPIIIILIGIAILLGELKKLF